MSQNMKNNKVPDVNLWLRKQILDDQVNDLTHTHTQTHSTNTHTHTHLITILSGPSIIKAFNLIKKLKLLC